MQTPEHAALFAQAGLPVEEFDTLLTLIYQGPRETTPWAALLGRLRSLFDASFATLVLRNPASDRPGLIVNASVHGALLPGEPAYSEHYYMQYPFIELDDDQIASADELFGSKWADHPFYRQYLQPLDLRYILAANLRTDAGVRCAFFLSRDHAAHDFDERERARIAVLLPHLKRAVDLHATLDELESERHLYAGTIDRLLVGTVILDEAGKVMKCNDAAERLLAGKDGIQRSHDGLRAHYEVDNRRLQKSLKSALEHHQAGASTGIEAALLTRPDGAPPLNVLIRPIPLNYRAGSTPVRRPAVAVFLRDPTGSPPASRALLRKLFGLTATESEIALLMIDGLTLDEAAATLGVSRNTVRAHLRGVFAKTGATRQALLVKMLLNSVAAMV